MVTGGEEQRMTGVEPATLPEVWACSIQLSYTRIRLAESVGFVTDEPPH